MLELTFYPPTFILFWLHLLFSALHYLQTNHKGTYDHGRISRQLTDYGTINEVSTALIQCEGDDIPALGILPLGTANDFATSVGIPEALDKALKLAIAGDAIAIDMAQVNKQTCFINMATGGFGTRITTETPEKLKAALGSVSYIIHGLMRMDTLHWWIP